MHVSQYCKDWAFSHNIDAVRSSDNEVFLVVMSCLVITVSTNVGLVLVISEDLGLCSNIGSKTKTHQNYWD